MPQPKPTGEANVYTVIAARSENCANGVHTHALLKAPDGSQIHVFTIGERPELAKDVQMTGVKLAMRQQDTVVFYILEDYRIVASPNRAA